MTPTLGGVTKPGRVTPEQARKLLRLQKAAENAEQAYRDGIREVLAAPDTSTRAVADALGISHPKVQRLAKPPTE